ncbi:MAG TPA: DUF6786 family protein [Polyangiales bacterium]|nr:DUF6786 family protein [Polyangiales bacterium]
MSGERGEEQLGTYADDLAFLRKYSAVVQLQDASGQARVIVAPEYQGRVMTSSAAGERGASFGFIHRENVAKRERAPHMNVFGGEDRFWLGPEGGQYALYFPPGAKFDVDSWQVPEPIDWGAWRVSSQTPSALSVARDMELENYSGARFALRVDRTVRVLERHDIATAFGVELPESVSLVGYASENTITNTGETAWSKDKGLLSVWILGMYKPTPATTIVIPFRAGPESELGPVVNDAYFGKVPADRLRIDEGVIFFRGDGTQRGKIGIPRPRAKPIAGAYDAQGRVLTLVQYSLPEGSTDYVNSMWQIQDKPYGGDVVNSYNDGPLGPGKPPLGPFYELETSSPAAALAPGAKLTHVHRTLHVIGPRAALDAIAVAAFGVSLERIERALGP